MMKIALAAAAVLAGMSAPALADDGSYSATISYAGLDLGTEDGRAAMDRRVNASMRGICATTGRVSLREDMNARACRSDFRAKAKSQLEQTYAARSAKQELAALARK